MKSLSFITAFKEGIRNVGLVLTSVVLTQHGKRLLFIASLYCYIARLDALRDDALEKLNEAMSLAKHGSALRLPAAARDVVWGDVNVQSVVSMDDFDKPISARRSMEIAENVVALSPRWLRYGNKGDMIADVITLIRKTTNLSTAQAA